MPAFLPVSRPISPSSSMTTTNSSWSATTSARSFSSTSNSSNKGPSSISWPLPSIVSALPEPTWGLGNESRYRAWPPHQWSDCEETVRSAEAVISLFAVRLKGLASDKKRQNSKLGQQEKKKIVQIIQENERIKELNEPFALFISLRRHYFTHERIHLAHLATLAHLHSNSTQTHSNSNSSSSSSVSVHSTSGAVLPSSIPEARIVARLTDWASSCEERDDLEREREEKKRVEGEVMVRE